MAVFAQSAQRANLTIAVKDMDFLPSMSVSPRELEQLFFILVQNAIDAADPEKHQKLTISSRVESDCIELTFADTCRGIEPAKFPHVFDPFFSVQSGSKDSGLGLAVAKQIICAHGGQITAQSQPGKGTTFKVTLPTTGIVKI